VPRGDDAIIATPTKAGTTWTQAIFANLLFPEGLPDTLTHLSYWIEQRAGPVEDLYATLDCQTHRRFIKTHLPTDGLPLFASAKYIAVGRDGRDIGVSLWNHYSNYSDFTRERISQRLIDDGGDGSEFPIAPATLIRSGKIGLHAAGSSGSRTAGRFGLSSTSCKVGGGCAMNPTYC
jgi:hypothetical protein